MIPKPAQYLLRFDDLCPTVSQRRWRRFLPLIEEFGIQPILGVIPDNRDPQLEMSPPDPEFWDGMQALEASGATIAMHGYRHRCESWYQSLLPLHQRTEFAGVSLNKQREWIRAGLKILRGHGLNPRLWIAPRHGFDWNTLDALRAEGLTALSDGFARVPVVRGGITWIPQQLWEPVEKSKGLWTICIHPNTASNELVEQLSAFLDKNAAQFTSVDHVLAQFNGVKAGVAERAYEQVTLWRTQYARFKKRQALERLRPGNYKPEGVPTSASVPPQPASRSL